jgi:hypothetical protein
MIEGENALKEECRKEVQKEKDYVGLWALLVGLPLGLFLSVVFYFSGLHMRIGENIMFKFTENAPNIMFTLIALPWTIAGSVAALIGGVKLGRKKGSARPLKVAILSMVDFSMWVNGTAIGIGVLFFHVFNSVSFLSSYIAVPFVTIVSLVIPIVGIPVILDFVMPKLWNALSCRGCGFFEGKLIRNLMHSWRRGELQRGFYRRVKIGILVVLVVYALLVVLALLGFLR